MRGSLKVTIKLQFIGNDNPFRDSSAGVQFFSASTLSPTSFIIQEVIGFVVDLVVEDDPESSWQDYFRTNNKSSNDNRLKILYNLSAEVRREVGKKVLELGGNAVIGYSSHFDIESGLVARAYGTACRLLKVGDKSSMLLINTENELLTKSANGYVVEIPSTAKSRTHMGTDVITVETDFDKGIMNDGMSKLFHVRYMFLSPDQSLTSSGSSQKLHSYVKSYPVASPLIQFGVTEKNSLGQGRERGDWVGPHLHVDKDSLFQSEVKLLSMTSFGDHTKLRLGGLVIARSVKFLGKLEATLSDQETREGWWEELRDEIRMHANSLCCSSIIGYSENCTVIGDVCVLSAVGTAAVAAYLGHPQATINILDQGQSSQDETGYGASPTADQTTLLVKSGRGNSNDGHASTGSLLNFIKGNESVSNIYSTPDTKKGAITGSANCDVSGSMKMEAPDTVPMNALSADDYDNVHDISSGQPSAVAPNPSAHDNSISRVSLKAARKNPRACAFAHVPYNHNTAPFAFMRLVPCMLCRRKWVPETLLSTIEPPHKASIRGRGQLLEARVCRTRRSANGEADAVKISEVLPFVEFDLQRQIMLKLKVLGMNSAFGIRSKIQIGNGVVIATASCTAIYLNALPPPPILTISRSLRDNKLENDPRLQQLQKNIEGLCAVNRQALELAQEERLRMMTARRRGSRGSIGEAMSRAGAFLPLASNMPPSAPQASQASTVAGLSASAMLADSLLNGTFENPTQVQTSHVTPTARERDNSSATMNTGRGEEVEESSSSSSSSSSDSEGDGSSLESPENSDDEDSEEEKSEDDDHSSAEEDDVALFTTAKESRVSRKSEDPESKGSRARAQSKLTQNSRSTWTNAGRGPSGKPFSAEQQKLKRKKQLYRDDRPPFLLEVDDETDVDISAMLQDWEAPVGIDMTTVSFVPGAAEAPVKEGKNITIFQRGNINVNSLMSPATRRSQGVHSTNNKSKPHKVGQPLSAHRGSQMSLEVEGVSSSSELLTKHFKAAYLRLCFTLRNMMPCQVVCLTHDVNILEEDAVEIIVHATAHRLSSSHRRISTNTAVSSLPSSPKLSARFPNGDTPPPPIVPGAPASQYMHPYRHSDNSSVADDSFPYLPPAELQFGGGEVPRLDLHHLDPTRNPGVPNHHSLIRSSRSILNQGTALANAFNDGGVSSRSSSGGAAQLYSVSQPNTFIVDDIVPPPPAGHSPTQHLSTVNNSTQPNVTHSAGEISDTGRTSADADNVTVDMNIPYATNMIYAKRSSSVRRMNSPIQQAAIFQSQANQSSHIQNRLHAHAQETGTVQVTITSLPFIPGATIRNYLGPLQLHFIKEPWSPTTRTTTEESLDAFFYQFLSEVNATARSHVAALGGNALLCRKVVLQESGGRMYRNQSYNLVSITGDVAYVEHTAGSNNSSTNNSLTMGASSILGEAVGHSGSNGILIQPGTSRSRSQSEIEEAIAYNYLQQSHQAQQTLGPQPSNLTASSPVVVARALSDSAVDSLPY
jgi:hypothetical protein